MIDNAMGSPIPQLSPPPTTETPPPSFAPAEPASAPPTPDLEPRLRSVEDTLQSLRDAFRGYAQRPGEPPASVAAAIARGLGLTLNEDGHEPD